MPKIYINKSNLFCSIVIAIIALEDTTLKLFPGISTKLIYKVIYYFSYIGSFLLLLSVFYVNYGKRQDKIVRVPYSNRYLKCLSIGIIFLLLIAPIYAIYSAPIAIYGMRYWTRWLSTMLSKICILLMVLSLSILLGKKAIECVANTFIMIYTLMLVICFLRNGLVSSLHLFLMPFGLASENSATAFMELHEIALSIGPILLYYIIFAKKCKHRVTHIILLGLYFVISYKRIGLFALAVAVILSIFLTRLKVKKATFWIFGFFGIVICIIYVRELYFNTIIALLESHGINLMGRDIIYNYFLKRTEFSIGYKGWGLAAVSKVIADWSRSEVFNMVNIKGLHNDLLQLYIELGFFGFLGWLTIYLLYIPLKLKQVFNSRTAFLYISLMCYAFITYMTDNTEGYFLVQSVIYLIPIADYLGNVNQNLKST